MKKLISFFVIVVLLVVLCSCQTSLEVRTLVPAKVSLGNAKVVAVAPTKVNSGSYLNYDSSVMIKVGSSITIPQEIASFRTTRSFADINSLQNSMASVFEKALDQGVYSVVGKNVTDSLITNASRVGKTVRKALQERSVDVLLTSEIDDLAYEEFISCQVQQDITYFVLNQRVKFNVSYIAQNVNTLEVLDTYTFKADSKEKYGSYVQTVIGIVKDNKYQAVTNSKDFPSFARIMDNMCSDFELSIRDRLTPHYEKNYVWLIEDKDANEDMKYANKLAGKGSYEAALTIFLKYWNSYRDNSAGYNAAAVYYALGDYENAMKLCTEVGSAKAIELYWTIKERIEFQKTALDQLNGIVDKSSSSELLGF